MCVWSRCRWSWEECEQETWVVLGVESGDDDDDFDSESYDEFTPHLSMSPVPLPNEVGEGIQLREYLSPANILQR